MSCSRKEFQTVTADLTGKLKLETADPCWLNLFKSRIFLKLKGDEDFFCEFCNKLRDNTAASGNLIQLLEQTSSRVHQIIRRKSNNTQNIEQACIGLHLIGLIINRFSSQTASVELTALLGFSSNKTDASSNSICVLMTIIEDSLCALESLQYDVYINYDICFFASNFLLCIQSTQLYQIGQTEISNLDDDPFLKYLYDSAESQLRAQDRADEDVSRSQPARIVRALLLAIVDEPIPPRDCIIAQVISKSEDSFVTEDVASIQPTRSVAAAVRSIWFDGLGLFWRLQLNAFRSLLQLRSVSVSRLTFDGESNVPAAFDAESRNTSRRKSGSTPLRDRNLAILLLLLQNRRCSGAGGSGGGVGSNPFREALCLLHDDSALHPSSRAGWEGVGGRQFDEDDPESISKQCIGFDFNQLAGALSRGLPQEGHTLLLYTLLQSHPTFVDTLVESSYLTGVCTGLLKGLYNRCSARSSSSGSGSGISTKCGGTKSGGSVGPPVGGSAVSGEGDFNAGKVDHIYVLIVCILMLVQEASMRQKISEMRCCADWYQESSLQEIPLLDLIALCTIRAALFGLFHLRNSDAEDDYDSYIVSNCSAILLNISPYLREMHPYCCQRVVSVVHRLCKRLITSGINPKASEDNLLVHGLSASNSLASASFDPAPSSPRCTTCPAGAADLLLTLLRLSGTALRVRRRASNVQLLYAFMHAGEPLYSAICHDKIVSLTDGQSCTTELSYLIEAESTSAQHGAQGVGSRLRSPSNSISSALRQSPFFGYSPRSAAKPTQYQHYTKDGSADLSLADFSLEHVACLHPSAVVSLAKHCLQALESRHEKEQSLSSASQAVKCLLGENAVSCCDLGPARDAHAPLSHPDPAVTRMITYTYAEAEDPELFFVPYVWRAVVVWPSPEISWYPHRIALFDPFEAGLLWRTVTQDKSGQDNV